MARQKYYVTRDMRHPLYRTRMLTAGQELVLDGGAASLYRRLGVDMATEKPKGKAILTVNEALTAEVVEEKPKAAPKRAQLDHDGDGKAGGSKKGSTRAKGKRKAKAKAKAKA